MKYMSKFFPNLTSEKGLQDEFSKLMAAKCVNLHQLIYDTNYCFSVAFYCDKLEYDNILQV